MSEPELTPAQTEAVRALLAEARHVEPVPADVAARLDATLADLHAERLEALAPVVTLTSRRRRMASTALLAAAAVVVVGVGVGQVLPFGSTDDSAGDARSSQAKSQLPDSPAPAEASRDFGDAQQDSSRKAGPSGEPLLSSRAAPGGSESADLSALRSGGALRAQVRKLRRTAAPATASFTADLPCLVDAANARGQVAVTYDGQPGVLVYRAPVDGSQRVDIYVCGGPAPVRSVRLPTR